MGRMRNWEALSKTGSQNPAPKAGRSVYNSDGGRPLRATADMGFFAALVSELKKTRCPKLEGYRPASGMTSIYQWFSDLPA